MNEETWGIKKFEDEYIVFSERPNEWKETVCVVSDLRRARQIVNLFNFHKTHKQPGVKNGE